MIHITICGSMKFAQEMIEWKQKLIAVGFSVSVPQGIEDVESYTEAGSSEEATNRKIKNNFIKVHYEKIKQSEGILVLNYDKNNIDNYIGGNSLMEMGFAHTLNRDIFLLNQVPNVPYQTEIKAMQPLIIDGQIQKIVEYYQKLPKVFVSSENMLKVSSTSLALREFNLRYIVEGVKTTSGISEQPFSIDETYTGAENRLQDLKEKTKGQEAQLYVSIESGNSKLHAKHNTWGLSVCIIENREGKRAVTIDTDLEMPKALTDLVPSQYPDLGVLVQEKYGIKDKDPYVYFTNGKLSRGRLLYNSVVNTLATLV